MNAPGHIVTGSWTVPDYDLAATLNSGQAFRWRETASGWEGVVSGRWVRLVQNGEKLTCQAIGSVTDWQWIEEYLQLATDLRAIAATFPCDPPMRAAVKACRGLRLLRQEPWEVLASFILSSTKQIVQIRQVVSALCRCFGEPMAGPERRGSVPDKGEQLFAFPRPEVLARAGEAELRSCKMGFRAPYLKAAAQAVASGELDLAALGKLPVEQARSRLEELPGVGPKVANCVLLYGWDFPTAFPLDVWVLRALRELYFKGKRPSTHRLRDFAETHFGPWSGYAQLYLFHYYRVMRGRE